jgi:site-specific DNA recombinase
MNAFIYCRVSTKEQSSEDHYSLDNQEQRCRDYLSMKRWRLHQMRKDVASGKNSERAGFQDLLTAIRNDQLDVVLVYRLDRLSRNVRDIYDFLDLIRERNVGFVSVTEGFDTTTAMGRAMLGVSAVFAQLTREMISENTKDGLLRRAEAGLYTGNTAMLYGYSYDQQKGLLVSHETETPVLRQIFDWFTESKWGCVKITKMLNVRRIPSKTGGQWNATTVANILRNPVYCGQVRKGDKIIAGQHEGIISQEQFDAAQAIIQSRAPLAPRSHRSPHLLSGIVHCGICGRSFRSHTLTPKNAKGEKGKYLFYRHPNIVKMEKGMCTPIAKSAPRLESAVVAKIREAAQSDLLQQMALDEVRSRMGSNHVPVVELRDKLALELAQLADKFTQWADRLDSGKIDEEQFDQQNRRLLQRKQELQKQVAQLEQELAQEQTLEVNLSEVRQTLENFPQVWDALEHEEQQEMLRLLIEDLRVFSSHAELKLLFMEPMTIPLTFRRS